MQTTIPESKDPGIDEDPSRKCLIDVDQRSLLFGILPASQPYHYFAEGMYAPVYS